jgi:two-component system OmpR family sensor kinase
MRLPLRSVRARLTLWYTVVLSIPLAAFAVTSYVVFSQALYGRTDAFISDALSVFAREVTSERRVLASRAEAIQRTLVEVRFRDLDVLVFDERGALLAMGAPARERAGVDPKDLDISSSPRTVVRADIAVRVLTRPYESPDGRLTLAGVYPLHEVIDTLARIRKMFLIVIPILILSAAVGGWFLAQRSLAPVAVMVEQQQRFMTDASHELRTPAAVLRSESEVTLSRPQRSEAEYRESMTVVRDAARRLTRIVDDIFLLARADAGHLVMQQAPLDVADVVVEAVRAVQAIAADREVRIEAPTLVGARVNGDADLLGRVLLNLLDNAVRHTPPGGAVTVRMALRGATVDIRVEDTGTGIPADAHDRVFERFFRVDAARSREERATSSGAGLGLAIARRIADMHGGRLELVSSRPGHTEFRVELPTYGAPVPA